MEATPINQIFPYVEASQRFGVYSLFEADLLCKCRDICTKKKTDPEITEAMAKDNIVKAVARAQQKGVFTLDEASLLYKLCTDLLKTETA